MAAQGCNKKHDINEMSYQSLSTRLLEDLFRYFSVNCKAFTATKTQVSKKIKREMHTHAENS